MSEDANAAERTNTRPSSVPRYSSSETSRVGTLAYLVVAVLFFATAWPVSKIGLAGATPIWFAAARAVPGAFASFALLGASRRFRWPTRADAPIILSIGVLQLCLFFALTNVGLRFVPAGRSVVLAYTTSLWLVPIAVLGGERIGAWRAAGVVLGIGGVGVLCNPLELDWSNRDVVMGNAFLLLAALCWALAIFHARRHRWHLSPLEVLPWQFSVAAALLVPAALVLEPGGGIAARPATIFSLLYVGMAGPIATWAATSVARALPMLATSLGFLSVPVLGMIVSAATFGETISLALAGGAALVLAGVGLVALGTARR